MIVTCIVFVIVIVIVIVNCLGVRGASLYAASTAAALQDHVARLQIDLIAGSLDWDDWREACHGIHIGVTG